MHDTLERLRAEFLEMPGLRLTAGQVQRLCGVERAMCKAALDVLVSDEFLRLNADGTYARLSDGRARLRPARATLNPETPRLRASA
jgi:hypothetical protein